MRSVPANSAGSIVVKAGCVLRLTSPKVRATENCYVRVETQQVRSLFNATDSLEHLFFNIGPEWKNVKIDFSSVCNW